LLDQLRDLAKLGFTEAQGIVPDVSTSAALETLGERVIPVAATF
jgi:hypothetical protein